VHARLDEKMCTAYGTLQEAMREKKVHPRLAAMVVGVARVAQACKLRGWV
jgi:glutamate dehydrogenase (NAD(P)+)